MTKQELWQEFLRLAREEVGRQVIETWFKSVLLTDWDQQHNLLTIQVPNQFVYSWLRNNYLPLLRRIFMVLTNSEQISFDLIVASGTVAAPAEITAIELLANMATITPSTALPIIKKPMPSPGPSIKSGSVAAGAMPANTKEIKDGEERVSKAKSLNQRYTFGTFVVGPNNHLAYSAAYAVAKGSNRGYNPLLIYGGTGLGKTHLLHCIGNEFRLTKPEAKIVYRTADSFVEEFIRSVRNDKVHSFREKYRKVDLLLIDDIQAFAGKEQTQEVFFNIFNKMYEERKQIVLSCDVLPGQISGLQERLKSRLGWGMLADVSAPTLETRVAILIKKAEDMELILTQEVATYIALKNVSNIREMEGYLTRLSALARLHGQTSLNLDFVRQHFQQNDPHEIEMREKSILLPHNVLQAIAKNYGISANDIRSRRRDGQVACARQLGAYLLKKHTICSLKNIGHYIGGRSHATVLHAIDKVKERLANDQVFASKVAKVENSLQPMYDRSLKAFSGMGGVATICKGGEER